MLLGAGEAGAPWDGGVGSLLGPGDPGDEVLLGAGENGTPCDEGLLEPGDEITPCDDGEDTAVEFNDDGAGAGAGAGAVCEGAASPPAMAPEDAGITVHAECVNVPLQESKSPSLHVRVCVSVLQI